MTSTQARSGSRIRASPRFMAASSISPQCKLITGDAADDVGGAPARDKADVMRDLPPDTEEVEIEAARVSFTTAIKQDGGDGGLQQAGYATMDDSFLLDVLERRREDPADALADGLPAEIFSSLLEAVVIGGGVSAKERGRLGEYGTRSG